MEPGNQNNKFESGQPAGPRMRPVSRYILESFRLFETRNKYFIIGLFVIIFAFSVMYDYLGTFISETDYISNISLMAVYLLINSLLCIFYFNISLNELRGNSNNIQKQTFDTIKLLPKVFFANFLSMTAVVAGSILIIPGVFLYIIFFPLYGFMYESKSSFFEIFSQCIKSTAGQRFQLFFLMLSTILIIYLPSFLIAGIAYNSSLFIVRSLMVGLIGAFSALINQRIASLVYVDLVPQKNSAVSDFDIRV